MDRWHIRRASTLALALPLILLKGFFHMDIVSDMGYVCGVRNRCISVPSNTQ